MTQKDYWSKIILDWEIASYGDKKSKKHLSILEKVASLFRYEIRHRRKLALSFIKQKNPNYLIELGCGSGEMSLNLASRNIVNKIQAFDIALPAIELARKSSKSLNLEDRVTFTCASIQEIDLNKFDNATMVVGLGLTPYLTKIEFETLIRFCSKRSFFIDFHLEGITIQNILHAIYKSIKRKPFPFYSQYNRKTLPSLLEKLGIKNPILEYSEGVCFVRKG